MVLILVAGFVFKRFCFYSFSQSLTILRNDTDSPRKTMNGTVGVADTSSSVSESTFYGACKLIYMLF